jgi:8-oxo-dGTP diphosphatase
LGQPSEFINEHDGLLSSNLNPHVSVDCVVFGFEFGKLNVLLIERNMLFEGRKYNDLKLPGDLVRKDEDLDTAATRVLKELTGLNKIYLKQFTAIGSPNRLSRQPRDLEWLRSIDHPEEIVVTIAYYSLINIDQDNASNFVLQSNARWCAVSEVSELAFDHLSILQRALQEIRTELMLKPIAFELLPPKFTLGQLQQLYEVILGSNLDKRNFRKKVSNLNYIVPINEKQVGVSHKPASYYSFSRKIYEKTRKDSF